MKNLFAISIISVFVFAAFAYAQEDEEGLKLDDEITEQPAAKVTAKKKPPLKVIIKEYKDEKKEAASKEEAAEESKPSDAQEETEEEGETEKEEVEELELDFVPWSAKKGIPTAPEDKDLNWSGGVSIKTRGRLAENMEDLNSDRYDYDLLFGHRVRGDLMGNYKNVLKLKASLQDARHWGRENATGSQDVWLDDISHGYGTVIHEAYLELYEPGGAPIMLRAGRMELAYGSELIIGRDDWNLVGNAFDAVLFRAMFEQVDVDLFYSRVRPKEVIVHPYGPCANTLDRSGCMASGEHLAGLDVKLKSLPYLDAEFYAFFTKSSPVEDDTLTTGEFTADETTLVTLGMYTSDPGEGPGIYKTELDFQVGKTPSAIYTRKRENHRAFALLIDGGWRGENVFLKPVITAGYALATGDDKPAPDDDVSGAFMQLYPSNHEKFGIMDLNNLSNMHDFHLNAVINPLEELKLELAFHYFLLQKYRDGWISADGSVVGKEAAAGLRTFKGFDDSTGNAGLPLGAEIDFITVYSPIKHFTLKNEMGLFIPGGFPKNIAALDKNKLDGKYPLLGNDVTFLWLLTAGLDF